MALINYTERDKKEQKQVQKQLKDEVGWQGKKIHFVGIITFAIHCVHPLWLRIVGFDSVTLLLHPMHVTKSTCKSKTLTEG